jgi:cell division initiation protein
MKITPLDIQQQEFRQAWRGYDASEVRAFLEVVRGAVEEVVRENATLQTAIAAREAELAEHRERERVLRETLVTAQRVCEDLKSAAKKEAEIVIGQAELQAERLVHNAQTRLARVLDDIREMKRQRLMVEEELRGVLASHGRLLDATASAQKDEIPIEENVAAMPARSVGGKPGVVRGN